MPRPSKLRRFMHWLAHLLWLNATEPDFDRGGFRCVGCGKFTSWEDR